MTPVTNNPEDARSFRQTINKVGAKLPISARHQVDLQKELLSKSEEAHEETRRLLNDQVSTMESALSRIEDAQAYMLEEMRTRWRQEDELIQYLVRRARAATESERLARAGRDETALALQALRDSSDYSIAWDDPNPLVSVRIASYQNTEALVDRAIASVLNQTHSNWELIVVNDGPNDRTRQAIESLGDSRIRYEEFQERSKYPADAHLRWMVAGSPGMNRGANLALGKWIAPLDDDDEFEPHHIESLLTLARTERAEFAYGAIAQVRVLSDEQVRIFSDPPAAGQISMQASIYHSGLRFMNYDTESWRVDEPGDWNLIRRMMDVGVRMAATEEYVTTVHMIPFDRKPEN